MPDLSEKLSHLEALREGATKGPWVLSEPHWHRGSRSYGRDCRQSIQAGASGTVAVAFGASARFDDPSYPPGARSDAEDSRDGQFIVDLVNASPWLILLARQAEKLAAVLEAVRGLLPDDFEQDEFNPHDLLSARLIEFEAIKKEAENGLHG